MPVFLKNVTKTRVLRVLKMCHLAATSPPRHRHEGGQCHVEFSPRPPCWCGGWRGPAKMWRGGAKIRRGPAKYWRGMSSQHNFTTLSSDAYVYFDITFDVPVFYRTLGTTLWCFLRRPCEQCCVCSLFWWPMSQWFLTSSVALQRFMSRYRCLSSCLFWHQIWRHCLFPCPCLHLV